MWNASFSQEYNRSQISVEDAIEFLRFDIKHAVCSYDSSVVYQNVDFAISFQRRLYDFLVERKVVDITNYFNRLK